MSRGQPNEFPLRLARGADMVEIHRGNVQGFPPKALACRHGRAIQDAAPGTKAGLWDVLERLRALERGTFLSDFPRTAE